MSACTATGWGRGPSGRRTGRRGSRTTRRGWRSALRAGPSLRYEPRLHVSPAITDMAPDLQELRARSQIAPLAESPERDSQVLGNHRRGHQIVCNSRHHISYGVIMVMPSTLPSCCEYRQVVVILAMMATRRIEPGPVGRRVARNIAKVREARGLSQPALARLMGHLGRPMAAPVLRTRQSRATSTWTPACSSATGTMP